MIDPAYVLFVSLVTGAARDLGMEPPKVRVVTLEQARAVNAPPLTMAYVAMAYVAPGKWGADVHVLDWALRSRARNRNQLRCIARHEVGHIALKQTGYVTPPQQVADHARLAILMRRVWGEQRVMCDTH